MDLGVLGAGGRSEGGEDEHGAYRLCLVPDSVPWRWTPWACEVTAP